MLAQLCPRYTQNHLFKKSLKFTSTHAGSTIVLCFCLSRLGHARVFYLLKFLQRVSYHELSSCVQCVLLRRRPAGFMSMFSIQGRCRKQGPDHQMPSVHFPNLRADLASCGFQHYYGRYSRVFQATRILPTLLISQLL